MAGWLTSACIMAILIMLSGSLWHWAWRFWRSALRGRKVSLGDPAAGGLLPVPQCHLYLVWRAADLYPASAFRHWWVKGGLAAFSVYLAFFSKAVVRLALNIDFIDRLYGYYYDANAGGFTLNPIIVRLPFLILPLCCIAGTPKRKGRAIAALPARMLISGS